MNFKTEKLRETQRKVTGDTHTHLNTIRKSLRKIQNLSKSSLSVKARVGTVVSTAASGGWMALSQVQVLHNANLY